jgi:hypothetical protein
MLPFPGAASSAMPSILNHGERSEAVSVAYTLIILKPPLCRLPFHPLFLKDKPFAAVKLAAMPFSCPSMGPWLLQAGTESDMHLRIAAEPGRDPAAAVLAGEGFPWDKHVRPLLPVIFSE